jgi:outer membrane receptor protein involved in Fe transport
MSYQSEVFFESSNYPGLSQDAYWLVDASLKFKPNAGDYSVELYADNLLDEEFLIDAGNTGGGLGIPTFVRGMPRIFGLRVNMDF